MVSRWVSGNKVTVRRARLVLGWVTVGGQVYHLSMQPAAQVDPASYSVLTHFLKTFLLKGAITSKIKHAIKLKTSPVRLVTRCAVIGCKLKQNANEGCNSCASLAGLALSFIACFILLVIAP